jgi:transposase
VLKQDPFSGWVFVFRNRPATALKALVYDGQGFWLCHKRL